MNTTLADFLTPNADDPIPDSHILTLVPEAPTQICVHIRLFASYREAARTSRMDLPLAVGARVSDVVEALAASIPALRTTHGLIAVNHSYVKPDFELHDGDEVALIPPVSGGADV